MRLHELQSLFAAQALNTDRRTLRLAWAPRLQQALDAVLLPQRAVLSEGICEPTEARITCLSPDAQLPLQSLLGQPCALQLLTDRGELRSFALVVTEAALGCCDGALTAVHLVARDAMSLMQERRRLRCFRDMSVVNVLDAVFADWRLHGLGNCFSHTWLGPDWRDERWGPPLRAGFIQHPDESDSGFVQRLLRGAGIAWFWRPGEGVEGVPRQELVLFDDSARLPQAVAGELALHRRDATARADSIDLLWPQWRLVPVCEELRSWDHETAHLDSSSSGVPGSSLAQALGALRVCPPHLGNSLSHLDRLAVAQGDHQRQRRCVLLGRSGVRTLAPGTHQRIDVGAGFEDWDDQLRCCTTVRVQHLMFNNLPAELYAPAQALMGEEDLPAWARGEPAAAPGSGRDARPPHRYFNRFEAVPREAPIVPPPLQEHEAPRLRPLTGRVLAPGTLHVHTDALGRSLVQLLGGEPGADTTAWVRHRTPWAGDGVGFSAVLRPGTEVDIEWLGPDRPVIAGCHYNGHLRPPHVAHCGALPGNAGQTALVGCELGGERQQHLLLDDHPGQPMAQLASEAGHSALSLGTLNGPRRQGEARPRGHGFELRSDAAGAIRTARALLLSAWERLEAAGHQLDAQEHVALMQECLELFKSLGRYAAQHQGLAADEAGQDRLLADVKTAAPGAAQADPQRQDSAPTLSLSAPAGIAATTPRTILSYAGVNIDSVAQQHLQWTAGQRLSAHAGQGINWFAQHGGISAIAHHGTWLMQSQHGDIEANAAQNIRWTATSGQLVGMARKIVLVAEDGSFLQLGEGGITLGTKGAIAHKSASFAQSGPATQGAELPTFGEGTADQRFVLRYGGHDGPVAAQRRFEIRLSDGSVVTGTSDGEGRTELLQRDAMHIAAIRILSDT